MGRSHHSRKSRINIHNVGLTLSDTQRTDNHVTGNADCALSGGDQWQITLQVGISPDGSTPPTSTESATVIVKVQQNIGQPAGQTDGQSIAGSCSDATLYGICNFDVGSGDGEGYVISASAKNSDAFPFFTLENFIAVRFLYLPGDDASEFGKNYSGCKTRSTCQFLAAARQV